MVTKSPAFAWSGKMLAIEGGSGMQWTVAVAFAVGSTTEVAVTASLQKPEDGAVYTPSASMVPTGSRPANDAWDVLQVTRASAVPDTVAPNRWRAPCRSSTASGATAIVAEPGESRSSICADAVLLGSSTLTAVSVTVFGIGGTDGAVYVPSAVIAPTLAPPPSIPFTYNRSAERETLPPITCASNCCDVRGSSLT